MTTTAQSIECTHRAIGCPRQESNLHPALRRRVLCPLSYEGPALAERRIRSGHRESTALANRRRDDLDGVSNDPLHVRFAPD